MATPTDIVTLAMGRILGMMQRRSKPGDVDEYERCRALILQHVKHVKAPNEEVGRNVPLPGWNFGSGNTGVVE